MGATTAPVRALDFNTVDLSASIPLLGRGRNAQDPYRGLVTDEGQLEIPFDLQGTGWWMTALYCDPETTPQAAAGRITTLGSSVTLSGNSSVMAASTSIGVMIPSKCPYSS